MKKSLFLLLILLLTGCATFQVSTLNHDPIYVIEGSDSEIDVINNEFELYNLLRTDFNFRYDFAQYALRQPRSFDWNNRLLGNRYNFYNPYYSRVQMWNDWVWGYNYLMPYRWSPFGYDRWGYNNYYGWNNYGWNWYNNWYYGSWYNRGYNIPGYKNRGRNSSQINGRKSNIKTSRRIVTTNTRSRNTIIKVKPKTRVNYSRTRVNSSRTRVNSSYRRNSTVRSTPNRSTRSTNNTSIRFNSRKKN